MEKTELTNEVMEQVSQKLADLIIEITDDTYAKLMGNMPVEVGEDEKLFIKGMILDAVASEVLRQLKERCQDGK